MKLSRLLAPVTSWRDRVLVFVPAAAWYGVIFAFSAQTGDESGKLSGAIVDQSISWLGKWGEIFHWNWEAVQLLSFLIRKAAHMGVFFILAALVLYGVTRLGRGKTAAWTGLVCAVLAALDEVHQVFVPGRDGKVTDVLIDLGGVACLLLVWQIAAAIARARRKAPARPGN